MLKDNLSSIYSLLNTPNINLSPEIITLINDILINQPFPNDPEMSRFVDSSIEDLLILSNTSACSLGVNYLNKLK